jgi:hypothetical protein
MIEQKALGYFPKKETRFFQLPLRGERLFPSEPDDNRGLSLSHPSLK